MEQDLSGGAAAVSPRPDQETRPSSRFSLFRSGLARGFPISVGYFSAAMAFGILCVTLGLSPLEGILFSMTNFAGASQFLAVRMFAAGAAVPELFIAVIMVNFRYVLMGSSLVRNFGTLSLPKKLLAAFGTTDETFALAALEKPPLSSWYFLGIEAVAYSGWIGGTVVGSIAGGFLPQAVQTALTGSLYAFFAALLGPELKKGAGVWISSISGALVNLAAVRLFRLPVGWAMVVAIAMGAALAFGFDRARDGRKGKGNGS